MTPWCQKIMVYDEFSRPQKEGRAYTAKLFSTPSEISSASLKAQQVLEFVKKAKEFLWLEKITQFFYAPPKT